MLRPDAALKIRHIFFNFNLPAVAVGALWVCFYALIMNREILSTSFVSDATIWNNAMCIQDIDKQVATDSFWKAIVKKTKHGFQ